MEWNFIPKKILLSFCLPVWSRKEGNKEEKWAEEMGYSQFNLFRLFFTLSFSSFFLSGA